jgi:hypothetical protein
VAIFVEFFKMSYLTSRSIIGSNLICVATLGMTTAPKLQAAPGDFQFEQSVYVVEGERTYLSIVRSASDTAETVYYRTRNGTASRGTDYQRTQRTRLDFLVGETRKTTELTTLQDTELEEDENLSVILQSADRIRLDVANVANVVIEDDDAAPAVREFNLESLSYTVDEGEQLKAGVTRTDGRGAALVLVGTNSVTAFHGEDYWGFDDQQVSFDDGETEKTIAINDTQPENEECFELLLSGLSDGYATGNFYSGNF